MNATKVTGIYVKATMAKFATNRSGERRDRNGVSSFLKRLSNRRVRRLPAGWSESHAQAAAMAAWDVAQEWQRAKDADWVGKVRANYGLDPITGEGSIKNALELIRDYANGTFAFSGSQAYQDFPLIWEDLELEVFRGSKLGISEDETGTGWGPLFHGIRAMRLHPRIYRHAIRALRACQDARHNSSWNE